VPQGSVLGPLLFLLYINDMPDIVENICKLFADDSKLIGVIKSAEDLKKLQIDIDKIVHWADYWKMRLNYKKCKFMVICNRKLLDQTIKLTMNTSSGEVHYCDVGT
jgi:hypothetical protein